MIGPEPLVSIADRVRAEDAELARVRDFPARVIAERQTLAERDPEAVSPLWQSLPSVYELIAAGEWDRPRAVPLGSISTEPPPPMLVGRLDPEGHTILYGPGGVGKGALACWWIVELVRTGHRVLILDFEGHATEWARRIGSLDPTAAQGVWYVAPSKPLRAIATDVKAECDQYQITYVVVDSAVMACGDDPMKPEAARAYGEGLIRLGRPALTLAHVTKLDDGRYPFGSVFWHNLARTTFSLVPDGDTTLLTHRKGNNYAKIARQAVTMTWTDGQLREVWERSYAASLGDEIADLLAGSAGMTLAAIVEHLSGAERTIAKSSVQSALTRGVGPMGRFTCVRSGDNVTWKASA